MLCDRYTAQSLPMVQDRIVCKLPQSFPERPFDPAEYRRPPVAAISRRRSRHRAAKVMDKPHGKVGADLRKNIWSAPFFEGLRDHILPVAPRLDNLLHLLDPYQDRGSRQGNVIFLDRLFLHVALHQSRLVSESEHPLFQPFVP